MIADAWNMRRVHPMTELSVANWVGMHVRFPYGQGLLVGCVCPSGAGQSLPAKGFEAVVLLLGCA